MRRFVPAIGIAALLALVLTSVQAAPGARVAAVALGAQENLSGSPGQSEAPQAVVFGSTLRVVWGERNDNAVLFKEKPIGGAWPAADQIKDGTRTAQQWPDVAVTPDGTTHIVYAASNTIYHRSRLSGGSWSNKTKIADDNFPNPVRLAAASDGSLWVVWRDTDGKALQYRRSGDGGKSWNGGTIAKQSGNMFAPDIAIGPDNTPHVVWYLRNNNGSTARYADWNGSGWNVGTIGGGGGYVADPVIAVAGNNVQHVAYRRQSGKDWIIQHVTRAPGGGWSDQEDVRTTNGDAGYAPAIAVDNGGGVHITWSELNKGGRDVFYSVKLPGQGFSGPINVSENPSGWNSRSALVVTGDAANSVAHVFYQRGVRGQDVDEIYYRSIAQNAQPQPAPQPTPQPTPPPAPQPPADARIFPETGQYISGKLRTYWEQNGGLPVFGLPINPEADRQTLDGTYRMQIFERNRLELHPEKPWPYDVELGRLGGDLLYKQGRPWETLPREQPQPGCRFFPETQHNLCEPFLSYWRSYGLEFGDPGVSDRESLALFGMPLTGLTVETNPDGFTGQMQWFERARIELHPENPAPYNILLGRLGAEAGQ